MEDFDLTTEEGRKQNAIASLNDYSFPDHYTFGMTVHIEYVDEPPIRDLRFSNDTRFPPPNPLIKIGRLTYQLQQRGWVLIEAKSYRELTQF